MFEQMRDVSELWPLRKGGDSYHGFTVERGRVLEADD